MSTYWMEELALVERAALRIEAREALAEARFDEAHAAAEAAGDAKAALESPAFSAWMAARAETDAAWGRWAQVMDARPSQPLQAQAPA